MSHHSSNIPIFPDERKLNETNFNNWLDDIISIVQGRGLEGYLTGAIVRPTVHPPMIYPISTQNTPPNSYSPSLEEWLYRDGVVASILYQNVIDPKAHGISPLDSSILIANTLDSKFRSVSEISKIQAMQRLQGEKFITGANLLTHLDTLSKLRTEAS